MKRIFKGCLLTAVMALTACNRGGDKSTESQPQTAPVPAVKAAPATPLDAKRVELGGTTWNPAWDAVVEKAVPPEMLSRQVPSDVRRFCPRFYEMSEADKRAFWAYFFEALAGAETGLNSRTNVRHTEAPLAVKDRVTGEMVHAEGLLQLTYEDAPRYGCGFDWAADRKLPPHDPARTILNPENNLRCGIRILNNQIITQNKPLFTRSSYWSTLRPGLASYRVFAKQMTNPPLACGLTQAGRRRSKDRSAARRQARSSSTLR
jgi:hypothetical protein